MARKKHLVGKHLENVAASFLEHYRKLIGEYVRGEDGIYALYKGKRLYYVGLASNLPRRLNQHLKDRHNGCWDRFSIYLVNDNKHTKELESLVLRIVNPRGNRQSGKLTGSVNLQSQLSRDVREQQRENLRKMLGKRGGPKQSANRRQRTRKPRETDGELAPYLSRGCALRAYYRGEIIRARARRDGWVRYGSYMYKSPSGAAKAALKRNCNGWAFWHYQRTPGEWVPLRYLRGKRNSR